MKIVMNSSIELFIKSLSISLIRSRLLIVCGLIVFGFMVSASAFAVGNGSMALNLSNWVPLNPREEKAVTQFGVEELLVRYPDLFVGERNRALAKMMSGGAVDVIIQISVTSYDLKWQGPTKCSPDNPLLTFTDLHGYSISYASGTMSTSTGPAPMDSDPCVWRK